jgi:hypothetical protein
MFLLPEHIKPQAKTSGTATLDLCSFAVDSQSRANLLHSQQSSKLKTHKKIQYGRQSLEPACLFRDKNSISAIKEEVKFSICSKSSHILLARYFDFYSAGAAFLELTA